MQPICASEALPCADIHLGSLDSVIVRVAWTAAPDMLPLPGVSAFEFTPARPPSRSSDDNEDDEEDEEEDEGEDDDDDDDDDDDEEDEEDSDVDDDLDIEEEDDDAPPGPR